jgi:hypothetical protein
MAGPIDLEKARKEMSVRKGFRNWKTRFGEDFDDRTRLADVSTKSLMMLAEGRDNSTFYLLDLIMNLLSLGSGFEFNDLPPREKMRVMDSYLFLLDRIRYEWMKRLGWLEGYPGEEMGLVDLVLGSEELAPRLQARTPALSREHPHYRAYHDMNGFQREELVRKLIPLALKAIDDQSTTL